MAPVVPEIDYGEYQAVPGTDGANFPKSLASICRELQQPLKQLLELAKDPRRLARLPESDQAAIQTMTNSARNLKAAIDEFENPTVPETGTLVPVRSAQHWNALIVDDCEANVLVAQVMLDQLGYDSDVAKNGREALEKFLLNDYDLILMDVQMRGLDGLEVTRTIRSFEKTHKRNRTPIVAVTANVCFQDKEDCLQAGMDDFIPKPFHPSEFALKLTHYIPADRKQVVA